MNTKVFLVLAVLVLAVAPLVSATTVSNPDITSLRVYVNGETVWYGECTSLNATDPNADWNCTGNQNAFPAIERGEQISVKAVFESRNDLDNVIVHTWLRGSGQTLEDQTTTFDVYSGKEYAKFLYLDVPANWNADEGYKDYTLHVALEADNDPTGVSNADMKMTGVQRAANLLQIMSVNFDNDKVNAGDVLKADVVVKNTGNHQIDDVYLKATIKELGLSKVYYIGDLAAYDNCEDGCDKQDTVNQMVSFTLPSDASAGVYTLVVEAYDGDVKTSENAGFVIESGSQTTGKVDVTPQITRNDILGGEKTTYTMIVTNNDNVAKRIVLSVSGTEGWSTSEIMPASFTLAPGESKLVSINLNVNDDAVVAEHLFSVEVSSDDNAQKFNFIANVTAEHGSNFGLKEALLVIGIVLAVIIVILLIVLLTRRTSEEKPEESYY